MEGKTKVKILSDGHQQRLQSGDVGYIDGYIYAGDNRPCAVVVCKHIIELIPMYALKAIK